MKTSFVYFCKLILFPITRLFVEKIKGKENIPEGGFIVAANHISGWDHCFITDILEKRIRDIRFIGAMDSVKTFFQSSLIYYLADTIAINRKRVDREVLLGKMIECLEKNRIIIIYPEGDSNKKEELLKGKTGIAELIFKSKVPVILMGTRKIRGSGKRIIEIGKPLYFKEERKIAGKIKDEEEYHLFLREVTDKIMREISKLCGKPYPNC
ncbi:1-acyl-sn-glycerol-3-phosphate acyltransferase [Candidatus Parcubacteria bacterium]|nr:1-acyl-sn-glycerol-3-phosphate acyltransferase [Candidatus Parcubacteria bacterium]